MDLKLTRKNFLYCSSLTKKIFSVYISINRTMGLEFNVFANLKLYLKRNLGKKSRDCLCVL
jgi:hypothetical protein